LIFDNRLLGGALGVFIAVKRRLVVHFFFAVLFVFILLVVFSAVEVIL